MNKRNFKKIIAVVLTVVLTVIIASFCFMGCASGIISGSRGDKQSTLEMANKLQTNQPTPTDIDYSLERYNLIRRAYWVNGQREKANDLPCEVEKPLGYIVLISNNIIIGNFVVDGKVSSLNSFLTPNSEYYEKVISSSEWTGDKASNKWLADVDGSYGENDKGIFFFTPDGKYIEWTGTYLYSDIPFEASNPVLKVGVITNE